MGGESVMQRCALMFNFAWLPYSFGRRGKSQRLPEVCEEMEVIRRGRGVRGLMVGKADGGLGVCFSFSSAGKDFGESRFKLSLYASDTGTDTHALVFEADDQIVVTFRGTTSNVNLRTDLSANLVSATPLLDSEKAGEKFLVFKCTEQQPCWQSYGALSHPRTNCALTPSDNSTPLSFASSAFGTISAANMQIRRWRQPKVHSGFLVAYRSVSQQLLKVRLDA